jgi:hypothetical protein
MPVDRLFHCKQLEKKKEGKHGTEIERVLADASNTTVPTQLIQTKLEKYAYRRFGAAQSDALGRRHVVFVRTGFQR